MFSKVHQLLLQRRGILCLPSASGHIPEALLQAADLEWAALGYAASTALRQQMAYLTIEQLNETIKFVSRTLAEMSGAGHRHRPLFKRFPDGVDNPDELWRKRFLIHFLQNPNQACLFCGRQGTTHVLSPCQHVVCDHCFDGRDYAGCPICGGRVDPASPFLQADEPRPAGKEFPVLKLLQPGDVKNGAKEMLSALCARTQAITPQDAEDLNILAADLGPDWSSQLPASIPVRENLARVFAALLKSHSATEVLAAARPYMSGATDVLRLLAAYSGADPGLQARLEWRKVKSLDTPHATKVLAQMAQYRAYIERHQFLPFMIKRFRIAKLSRALRRGVLGLLESFPLQSLTEDLLRHRSLWVWLGEFLHPHEYAKRFPNCAAAFAAIRKRAPDGTRATPVLTWNARLQTAQQEGDWPKLIRMLSARPGEFSRRIDHLLRSLPDAARADVMQAWLPLLPKTATPMLMSLLAHLSRRTSPFPVRVYWPKGGQARCVSAPDQRPALTADDTQLIAEKICENLLTRFATLPPIEAMVVDSVLAEVPVPFNQRTAAKDAWQLPRGATLSIPMEGTIRLFLHWCQHPGQHYTDLDLSVAFYDESWAYLGVCSYYQLKCLMDGHLVAHSAGDLTSAPWPEGASEFVDLNLQHALRAGVRYAVMVVNNYAGAGFEELARAYAGIMRRQDAQGKIFDPRTVETKFALSGKNGVFLPVVFDFIAQQIHWLDVHARGQFEMNNVESARNAIATICPTMMTYFASGVRPSMLQLGMLHAAARAQKVWLRAADPALSRLFLRQDQESAAAFLARMQTGEGIACADYPFAQTPVQGMLDRGDLQVAAESKLWVMRPASLIGSMAAADWLSV